MDRYVTQVLSAIHITPPGHNPPRTKPHERIRVSRRQYTDLYALYYSDNKRQILNTAHPLFYKQGIRATGVDTIIAQSGVAKMTFYKHFSSKQLLIIKILKRRDENRLAWFKERVDRNAPRAAVPSLISSNTFRGSPPGLRSVFNISCKSRAAHRACAPAEH